VPVCTKCGQEASPEDIYTVNGQGMCEDCALANQSAPKPCDVWAVRIATNTRKQLGMQGTEGLTERQAAIYEFIAAKNGATMADLQREFNLAESELRKELAVLRHCELGRAEKRGVEVYYVPWDIDQG